MPAHVDLSQPHPQPAYPTAALASGEQGTVLVNVLVPSSGHISEYRLAQSSGFGDLDNAALESVLGWRFVPAVRDGDTVTDWTTVKVVFELPQPAAPPAVAPTSN
ncbi:MAG: energy transducer TonB [Rhizomicrobium sp.]